METKYIVNNVTGQTINGQTFVPSYKVYTALLSQSGDGTSTFTNGTLDIGKLYEITNYQSGDDFTNVANVISGTINTTGCKFLATGTTPTIWTNSTELTDTSAPVATVLENTLGGSIVWTRVETGEYLGTLNGVFTLNKSVGFLGTIGTSNGNNIANVNNYNFTIDSCNVQTFDLLGNFIDDILYGTFIEIRVYN